MRAFQSAGFKVGDMLVPRHGPGLQLLGPAVGYGSVIGETGLVIAERGWTRDTFSSFVLRTDFWVDPPLPKHFVDQGDLPHVWKAAVGAGQFLSKIAGDRHVGYWRAFEKWGSVTAGNDAIPSGVLAQLF